MANSRFAVVCAALIAALPLAAQSEQGYLKAKVNPGRAGVFVNGKYVGPAANFGFARKYALAAGEHEVRFSEPRYADSVQKVTITPGKTTVVRAALNPVPPAKPPFGRLRILGAGKYDAVYINGKYFGHADEFSNFAQGILLNPGDYVVKVAPPDGSPGKEEKISIVEGSNTLLQAK